MNLRELQDRINRAVAMTQDHGIDPADVHVEGEACVTGSCLEVHTWYAVRPVEDGPRFVIKIDSI